MAKLRKEMLDRMDGLSNVQELQNFKNAVQTIGMDLYEDGFEIDEIDAYFKFLVFEVLVTHVR